MNIIAADVGGTKTRFIYADADEPKNVLYEACYRSGDFDSFEPLLETFIRDSRSVLSQIETLALALPGLVSADSARLTNLPWAIEKKSLKDTFGIKNVSFINDFQASAFGTTQLLEKDQIVLNPGTQDTAKLNHSATRVVVGAGTGLGIAWAQGHCECDGHKEVMKGHEAEHAYDTEGGHIDFAPADDTQIRLLQFLRQRYDHVSYERILSGDGLVSLYEFCAGKKCNDISAEWVSNQVKNDEAADQALSLFVQVYGAYIGNVALLFKPYGGIFITGGIAKKILSKMQSKEFINAYLNKGRMRILVEEIAVYLVTNERVGVLGAMSEAIKMRNQSLQHVLIQQVQ